METFLANRPKVPAPESSLSALEDLSSADAFSGDDAFGMLSGKGGGFQSLRTALLEAGSVVDPNHRPASSIQGNGASSLSEETHTSTQEPTVELITDGGRIEKIIVTCPCCRRIELNCTY